MCPEYGATVAIFPIDDMTLDYLRLTGRDESRCSWSRQYAKAQGLFRTDGQRPTRSTRRRSSSICRPIEPSLAGPKRPQDRVSLKQAKAAFQTALPTMQVPSKPQRRRCRRRAAGRRDATGAVAQSGVAVADPALESSITARS